MSKRNLIYIGNQTAFSAATVKQPFDYAVQNGFDAFEWFPDKKLSGAGWDENDLDVAARFRLREIAQTHGIRISVHARLHASPLDADTILFRDIELARDLGASLINVHLFTGAGIEAYVQAILPLADRIGDAGLQLSIENTVATSPEDFDEFFSRLYESCPSGSSHVGMCFDLGHANLFAGTRNNYLEYLERLHRDVPIIHLHLHENWGDHDSHLPLFTGPAGKDQRGICEFVARMKQRKFSGSIILEQWPHPPSLLNSARDTLKQLFARTLEKPVYENRSSCARPEFASAGGKS